MSDVNVAVTQAGEIAISSAAGDTFVAQIGNGGSANITVGEVSPGNAAIVSGTLTINSTTTLPSGSSAYAKNVGTSYAAAIDFGIPTGSATNIVIGNTTTLAAGSNATVNATPSGSNLTLAFGIPRGFTPIFAVGNVATGAAGSSASVFSTTTNGGANVTLDLTIPRGATGSSGANGVTPSIAVGNVATGNAGSSAVVTATTTNNGANVTLDLTIPRGETGASGINGIYGINGINGIDGITPSFSIGSVTTGAAGSSAAVTATTTNNGANVTLNLTIPRGATGASGSNGANGTSISLSDDTPENLGTASPGTSILAARADHVHSLPIISYANLSNVPTNFPTNTTLVSGLSSSYSAIAHGHNYVTSLNNLTGGLTLAAGSNLNITSNGSTLTLSSSGGIGANDAVDGGDYVGEIVYSGTITITQQPQNKTAIDGVASFSVVANVSPAGTLAYQWQRSDNNGSTWITVVGATASNVSLSGLTISSDDNDRYRVVVSSAGASSVTSNSATLTVPDNSQGTAASPFTIGSTATFTSRDFVATRGGVLYVNYSVTFPSSGLNNLLLGRIRSGAENQAAIQIIDNGVQSGSADSSSTGSTQTGSHPYVVTNSVTFNAGDTIRVQITGSVSIQSMTLWIA
jgi:hypothetical protein